MDLTICTYCAGQYYIICQLTAVMVYHCDKSIAWKEDFLPICSYKLQHWASFN